MINWTPYLESVCKKYAQWWNFYTLTDVAGKMRSPNTTPLLTDLRVQAVKESREEKEEKTEQYNVLEGLRKYAANHVLLVGRPGSGKSTALVRLLLEQSEKAQGLLGEHSHQEKIVQIPILLELRYYETSIIDLILQFLKRHDLMIDSSELETVLLEKADVQLLLLFDGVNELPSEKGRLDLQHFRNSYEKVSMIFSTRDLGLGGDLNLEKRFEMLPLTEPKMKEFVRAYLPENSEEMLKQLGDHLREFGQTPLLLWMLCSVFENNDSQIPSNLGLVFRRFTEIYDHQLKADVSTFQESREWWRGLLRVLAWKMTEGESKTEIKVAISRREAELELTTFVLDQGFPKYYAKKWLEDLLKHHLIQLEGNDQITFRHQLIQEYYAAEMLLEKISDLSDWELQWNYLNYLKWTEPFALMLGMIDSENQAQRVVKLGLEVDLTLGARLAGEVKDQLQKQTVEWFIWLDILPLFKVMLLGLTKSNYSHNELTQLLEDSDYLVRKEAVWALGNIGSDSAIPELLKALEDSNPSIREKAVWALGNIGSDSAISGLLRASEDSDHWVRHKAEFALSNIGYESPLHRLLKTLEYSDEYASENVAEVLGELDSDSATNGLLKELEDSDYWVRLNAVEALGEIGSDLAIHGLIKALEDSDESVRKYVVFALGKMGSDSAVRGLLEALKNSSEYIIRMHAAFLLGQIASDSATNGLLEALEDPSEYVRMHAAEVLGEIGSDSVTSGLIEALEDPSEYVRMHAAEALGEIGSDSVTSGLIEALEDPSEYVRRNAVEALGKTGSNSAIPALRKALEDSSECVRENAAFALSKIDSDSAIPELLKVLENSDKNSHFRCEAAFALGEIGSNSAIHGLLKVLEDSNEYVRSYAAEALGNIGSKEVMVQIINYLHDRNTFHYAINILTIIQNKLKYYSPVPQQDNSNKLFPPISTFSPQLVTYDLRGATIGNLAHNLQGNQQTTQINKKNHDSTT